MKSCVFQKEQYVLLNFSICDHISNMNKEELEFLTLELEKCIRNEEIEIDVLRTKSENRYKKRIEFSNRGYKLDLLKIIMEKEVILHDGKCYLLLKDRKYDFTNETVQNVWYSLYETIEEELFLEQLFSVNGIVDYE